MNLFDAVEAIHESVQYSIDEEYCRISVTSSGCSFPLVYEPAYLPVTARVVEAIHECVQY
jgi:pyruvate/2-oxoglutarate/acetoin dehydrogenase E1 component